jgi:hypothetical protein
MDRNWNWNFCYNNFNYYNPLLLYTLIEIKFSLIMISQNFQYLSTIDRITPYVTL